MSLSSFLQIAGEELLDLLKLVTCIYPGVLSTVPTQLKEMFITLDWGTIIAASNCTWLSDK